MFPSFGRGRFRKCSLQVVETEQVARLWPCAINLLAGCSHWAVAAVGVYLLARRFCDPHQSLLACALFATHSTVVFAAADAGPFALALMAVVWSILMLIRLSRDRTAFLWLGLRVSGCCEHLFSLPLRHHDPTSGLVSDSSGFGASLS